MDRTNESVTPHDLATVLEIDRAQRNADAEAPGDAAPLELESARRKAAQDAPARAGATKTTVTRVYRCGALAPVEGADVVHAQMRAAHRYHNTLLEIERGRRAAAREALEGEAAFAAARAVYGAATQRLGDALTTAGRERATAGSASAEAVAEVVAARAATRPAGQAFRAALAAAQREPAVRARLDAVTELALELGRSARKHCGVYWGTYLLVEAAVQATRKDLPLYDEGAPNDPQFRRWTGEGRVGVHIQGERLTTAGVFRENRTVYLVERPRPPGCDPTSRRSQRRQHLDLMLRVSSQGRAPVWARVPLVLHRPLPPGEVTWVTLALRRIGPRDEWFACITMNADRAAMQPEACGVGDVAIDLGWRAKPDGSVRVALWKDRDGASGEVLVPASIRGELAQCDALRGRRDENFNVARAELGLALERLAAPAWLQEATATLPRWRSLDRLRRLAVAWEEQRFAGDLEAFTALWAWRKQDLHLWSWEASQRTKAQRHRTHIYRNVAAGLARRYGRVVLEDFDVSDVARRPTAEVTEAHHETRARANRQGVAVSTFRLAVTQAFAARGGELGKHDPAYTTQTCNACGHVGRVGLSIDHVCAACGASWDQDVNASENLLDLDAAEKPPVAPVAASGSKWQKAGAARTARKERLGVAPVEPKRATRKKRSA